MELVTGSASIEDVDGFLDELDRIGAETGCTVQAFDARYVAGPDHLRRAVELADRAIDRDDNVARDRKVEILLYAAGRRQIDRALEMGVGSGETPVVVAVVADPETPDPATRERQSVENIEGLSAVDPGGVEYGDPDRIRGFFGIDDAELDATDADLSDLVVERVALLSVDR